ncbi:rRNA accumulation- protein [Coemansia sp. RSA 1285]|nr:rRNA accumulation- protein [Coemansia sp. RSA 1285]
MAAAAAAGPAGEASAARMHPNKEAFIEGVDHVLAKWTALELAVQNGWGGRRSREKRDTMVDEIVEYFDQQVRKKTAAVGAVAVEPTDVEELLLQVMDEDFSVMLEDQSEKEVARLLCTIFAECRAGNFETVDRMADEREAKGAADSAASRSQAAQGAAAAAEGQDGSSGSESDDGSDDSPMEE